MLLALALVACGEKTAEDSGDPFCADAPEVSWESYGQAILDQWCQPCHASTAENRHGAPEAISFDTYEQVIATKSLILAAATSEEPSMPPSLALPEEDVYRLKVWLMCWE